LWTADAKCPQHLQATDCATDPQFLCAWIATGQRNQGMSYSRNGQWRDGPGSSTRQVGITSGRLLVSREFQKQEWTSLSPPHFVI